MNWGKKIKEISIFGKKTLWGIHKIKKNTQFGLVFAEKSRNKISRENSITKREKMLKIPKIYLTYLSKLNYNVIGQRLGGKYII